MKYTKTVITEQQDMRRGYRKIRRRRTVSFFFCWVNWRAYTVLSRKLGRKDLLIFPDHSEFRHLSQFQAVFHENQRYGQGQT